MVMTVMCHGINEEVDIQDDRVNTTNLDEVLFADDTICVSDNAQSLTTCLCCIQIERPKYGLTVNMSTFAVI